MKFLMAVVLVAILHLLVVTAVAKSVFPLPAFATGFGYGGKPHPLDHVNPIVFYGVLLFVAVLAFPLGWFTAFEVFPGAVGQMLWVANSVLWACWIVYTMRALRKRPKTD